MDSVVLLLLIVRQYHKNVYATRITACIFRRASSRPRFVFGCVVLLVLEKGYCSCLMTCAPPSELTGCLTPGVYVAPRCGVYRVAMD